MVYRKTVAFLLGNQLKFLGCFCTYAYFIRKWRRPVSLPRDSEARVLHITCSFDIGGTQRQIMNLCANSGTSGFLHEAVEIFPEANYLYHKAAFLDRSRYVRGNIFARSLGKGVMSRSTRSLQTFQIYKLVRDFVEMKPAIVVGWGHEVAMLSFVAASIARVPKIVFCIRTFNPSYGWTNIGAIIEKAHKKMAPHLNAIMVNSTALQKDYSEWLGIPKEKIRVCPNGVDPLTASPEDNPACRREIRRLLNIPDDAVVIIHVGRFSKEKGQMLLAKAYRRLLERRPGEKIYCLFCGDGPTKQEVELYAGRNGLDRLLLAGRIQDVHSYLRASDIFVMPSDFEGMPNSMMEAMACGLPCISTNVTGALDVARDGVDALYIDVGSVDQLVEKLSYLAGRPDERRRIGSSARERLKEFSVANMVERFNRHLKEMVKNG